MSGRSGQRKCSTCKKSRRECTCRPLPLGSIIPGTRDRPSNDTTSTQTSSVSQSQSPSSTRTSSRKSPASKASKQLVKLIKQHLRRSGQTTMDYDIEQIKSLVDKVSSIVKEQETLIRCQAPIKIVGDIHGQYTDLKRILQCYGQPPETKYIFLGDYVDRGRHSLECIMLLFAFKALYPNSIILLRGNHECASVNRVYGFYDEMHRRGFLNLYNDINRVFDLLPLAAVINEKILCMHGGISKYLVNLDQITHIRRPMTMEPGDCPDIALDLLWADPNKAINGFIPSSREASFEFGMDALEKFCRRLNLDLVVRGHQVVPLGFERLGQSEKTRIVTLFSAPNYCNEMDNSGAIMEVSERLSIHFSVLDPCVDSDYIKAQNEHRNTTPIFDHFPKPF